jgi:Tol biopolymer transport system component
MALSSGTHLGPYEILSALGAGGMGEVYRARDTRLKREVALKVLPEGFSQDPDRLARFQREAELLATLNHPNIAAVYGLEKADGVTGIVLELVEGETLADAIARGPIPLADALPLGRQIADALEAAHEKGVIHRDLKPANIKVTSDGKVKVLDFGLAKMMEHEPSASSLMMSPTLSVHATRAGVILGTAAYMSPEQARGKVLDRRADIWAFGCVLLECLTGRQVFSGDTVSDTIAAILTREPDLDALPTNTPGRIRDLLRRCLQKDTKRRLHDIADARIEIEDAVAHPEVPAVAGVGSAAAPARGRSRLFPWGVALALAMGLAAVGWRQLFTPRPATLSLSRLHFELPQNVTFGDESYPLITLSLDGTRMVFVGRENGNVQLFLRRMDQWESKPIAGTLGADKPFLSPDGQWVAFTAGRKLKKVAIDGGPVVDLCDAEWGGGSWGLDDQIVYSKSYNEGLWRIPASGGTPQMLTSPDRAKGELSHWWPQILPGGEWVLFTAFSTPVEKSRIAVRSLKTGEQKTVLEGGVFARYVVSGNMIFARGETLLTVPFDLRRMEATGAPTPVLDGVYTYPQNGVSQYAASDSGTLAFVRSASLALEQRLVSVDRSGKVQTIRENLQTFGGIRLSPDGRRLAMAQREGGHAPDVWILDLERGSLARLTFGPASNFDPVWTMDGKRLFYVSERPVFELYSKAVDGSTPEEAFLSTTNDTYPASVSPDGKALLLTISDPRTGSDLWLLPLEGKREPKPLSATSFEELGGAFSPDGRWIAFETDESGKAEVYVQDYPGGGNRMQISTDGGAEPVWARNGKELFYRVGKKLMVVPMGADAAPGKPRVLFEGEFKVGDRIPNYDVSPDGSRLYFIQTNTQSQQQAKVDIVLNWFEELKARAPTK